MAVVINANTGFAENLPDDATNKALSEGTHNVALISPEGEHVNLPMQEAQAALKQGFKQPDPAQLQKYIKSAEYESSPGKAVAEEFAAGATMGLSTAAEVAAGVPKEDILGRREAHPIKGGLARGVGFGVAALGLGELAGAVRGAAAVQEAVASSALSRVGSAAAKQAVEMAVFQSGDEATKAFISDPHQSVESALAHIGLAAAIGAGTGIAFQGGSELWKIGPGKKLEEALVAVRNRSENLPVNVKQAIGELPHEVPASTMAAISEDPLAQRSSAILQESNTKAGLKHQAEIAEFKQNIQESLHNTLGKDSSSIAALHDVSEHAVGSALKDDIEKAVTAKFEPINKAYEKFEPMFKGALVDDKIAADTMGNISKWALENKVIGGPNEAAENLVNKVLKAVPKLADANDIKTYVTQLSQTAPFGSEQYYTGKALRQFLQDAQEQTIEKHLADKAPQALADYQATRTSYRQAKDLLDTMNDRLHVGRFSGEQSFSQALRDMDPESVLRRLSTKGDVDLQKVMGEQFPDALQKVQQFELDKVLKKSIDKSGDAIDLNKLVKQIKNMQPEMRSALFGDKVPKIEALHDLLGRLPSKMNNSGTARTLDKLWEYLPASATGMGYMAAGHNPILGALLGHIASTVTKETPDAVRMAFLKYLGSAAPISAEGFAAASKVAGAMLKTEQQVNRGTKAIFEGTSTGIKEVSEAERGMLKKQLDKLVESEEPLLKAGEHVGHYAPEQATVLGMVSMRNVRYLQALKPKQVQNSPLDKKMVASKDQEQRYNQALDIATRPQIVLEHIHKGTLTPSMIADLDNLAPAMKKAMQAKVMQELVNHVSKDGDIPYKTKMALSQFMGQPLESSMSQQSIASAQMVSMQPPMPTAPQQQKMKHSSSALNKMHGMYQTPGQAREAGRSRR